MVRLFCIVVGSLMGIGIGMVYLSMTKRDDNVGNNRFAMGAKIPAPEQGNGCWFEARGKLKVISRGIGLFFYLHINKENVSILNFPTENNNLIKEAIDLNGFDIVIRGEIDIKESRALNVWSIQKVKE